MHPVSGQRLKDAYDHIVLSHLNNDSAAATSINDLATVARMKRRSVELSLQRLLENKVVDRKWDGNERFGRYLYFLLVAILALFVCGTALAQHVSTTVQELSTQHSKCLSDAYNQYGGGQNSEAFSQTTAKCNEQFKKSLRDLSPAHPKSKTVKPNPKPDVVAVAPAPGEWHPQSSDVNYPLIFILCVLGVFVYFIPSFVAWNKNHSSGIILLNIFLGWTLLGWVGALIWAVCEKPVVREPT